MKISSKLLELAKINQQEYTPEKRYEVILEVQLKLNNGLTLLKVIDYSEPLKLEYRLIDYSIWVISKELEYLQKNSMKSLLYISRSYRQLDINSRLHFLKLDNTVSNAIESICNEYKLNREDLVSKKDLVTIGSNSQ